MSFSNGSGDKSTRIEQIRTIVNEDYERITQGDDPYVVLKVAHDMSLDDITSRYERYERFYRAENFRRLGDMDLTRKALDIRRAIGRAIANIRDNHAEGLDDVEVSEVDAPASADDRAMGHIYFRDGLTYLQLGDLGEAEQWFERAVTLDPMRGTYLAYYSYTAYRQRPYDKDFVDRTRQQLKRAIELDDSNPDVHVLQARFLMKMGELDEAYTYVKRVEELDPEHPMLGKLRRKFERRSVN